MKMIRDHYLESGIFGRLEVSPNLTLSTLEHSYDLLPKVPEGIYECVRGIHRLKSMDHGFETFEIAGVPGHSNILFHCGNTESDSEGCVLLGYFVKGAYLYKSREAFLHFSDAVRDLDSFELEIIKGEQS